MTTVDVGEGVVCQDGDLAQKKMTLVGSAMRYLECGFCFYNVPVQGMSCRSWLESRRQEQRHERNGAPTKKIATTLVMAAPGHRGRHGLVVFLLSCFSASKKEAE